MASIFLAMPETESGILGSGGLYSGFVPSIP